MFGSMLYRYFRRLTLPPKLDPGNVRKSHKGFRTGGLSMRKRFKEIEINNQLHAIEVMVAAMVTGAEMEFLPVLRNIIP